MQVYQCRQNPYEKTDHGAIYNFIKEHQIITSPFGHTREYSHPLYNKDYTKDGNKQGYNFMEKLQIGDIVIIPFKNLNKIVIGEILSEPEPPKIFSGLYVIKNKKKNKVVKITNDPSIFSNKYDVNPWDFKPIHRKIRIIKEIHHPSQSELHLPNSTFCKIHSSAILEFINI